ncbi:hypothetical protein J7T55_010524 [Diaporthe amygdali]|uniref:uncharacterized protein n=1 Tax=Phomopsis amygdali TaxID=1214568 RepID=UPI0022FDD117|nr:uncharacterized protein J7T55_010524 [Diaporthe amygdali]KAJ0115701.1 hypothetical protein J7T55_010524 [Diaporthe amygdali]
MHFLCLHGVGTNSKIFELQTAALRYALGLEHTYDFVEGGENHPMEPHVANLISPDDTFHAYFDPTSGHSLLNALDDLDALVREADPPYDGVVGFSHGSTLAATLLTRPDQSAQPPFKVAVFLSPGMAANHASLSQDKIEILQPNTVYQRICIPTALVYAEKDEVAPEQGVLLQGLCDEKVMHVAIHQLGHQIPGIKEKRDLEEAVTAITLAIEDVSRKSER